MRTIKFRIWDKNRNKIYYPDEEGVNYSEPTNNGCLFYFMLSQTGILLCNDGIVFDDWHDSYEIDFFTGLLDRNGKEIYEWDILSGLNGKKGYVIFKDGAYCFSCDSMPLVDFCIYSNTNEWAEIIGNIHQHAHLLNK